MSLMAAFCTKSGVLGAPHETRAKVARTASAASKRFRIRDAPNRGRDRAHEIQRTPKSPGTNQGSQQCENASLSNSSVPARIAPAARLVEEPDAPLGLIDPLLDQARRCHVVLLVAEIV